MKFFKGYDQDGLSIVNEDDLSCIATSNNPVLHGRTKHMAADQSFLLQSKEQNLAATRWVTI